MFAPARTPSHLGIVQASLPSALGLSSVLHFTFYIFYLSAIISTPMSDLSQMTIGES